jgi:hypothetical protein
MSSSVKAKPSNDRELHNSMTSLLIVAYISLAIGICIFAQYLVREQGKGEYRVDENEHKKASFTTDVVADVLFAVGFAAAMTAYSKALPSGAFLSESALFAYASILLPLVFVFIFDRFLPQQPWARLLKKKVIYRDLLLIATFFATLSISFAMN